MKRSVMAALAAAALLVAPAARAQQIPTFDLERLSLDPSAVSSMVVGTGEVRPLGQPRVFLAGHYENRPLVVLTDDSWVGRGLPYDGTRIGDIVTDRITAHLGAAVSLTDSLEVSLSLPIVLWQDGSKGVAGVPEPGKANGVGTPAFGLRWQVMAQKSAAVNVALGVDVRTPFGTGAAVAGNDQWTFLPKVEVGHRFEKWVIGAQGGILVREKEVALPGSTLATEAQGGLVVATTGKLRGELSLRGAYADYPNARSMETLAGVRYAMADFEAFALGGPGFFEEPGTPKWRGVVGLAYAPVPKKAPPPPPAPVKVDPCAAGQAHTPDQCPALDDDGDGIKNGEDACPSVPGIAEEKGCPAKDTDGDGLQDHLDKCPAAAGPRENGGCPDTDQDGDGVVDRLDKCPDVAGAAEFQGCIPARAKVNLETRKIEILEKVYFDTGKATIQKRSFPLLDDVATAMGRYPEIAKVVVEGHTDNTGPADFNKSLSEARAKAVREYLVGKGVAAERLEAQGFGPDRPIADNKTKAGREQNRRVEFNIPMK